MELSESRTQGCGFEYESVPMLQKNLMSQASLIKAEVFKHILCERNMQDFKQFILTCLERWKSGHYLQDKIETIFTLTQYPDDHYSFLFVYVFEGEIGHLCQYYSYGCKHVPVKTRSTSTLFEALTVLLNLETGLKWKSYVMSKEKPDCRSALEIKIKQIHLWEPKLRRLATEGYNMRKLQTAHGTFGAQELESLKNGPDGNIDVVQAARESLETQLIVSTQNDESMYLSKRVQQAHSLKH